MQSARGGGGRALSLGCKVQGLECRVLGVGCRVQVFKCKVWGARISC
jgi:hypothetical protein